MPRFVVLRHEMPAESARATHWDFMLERDEALRTWALDAAPRAATIVFGTALADHRREYLDYEGQVSGNRGSVSRVEAGTYMVIEETERVLTVQLDSPRLRGIVAIVCLDQAAQRFSFSFAEGSPATAGDGAGCCGS
ncbi:MAG: hypothetical protein KF708_23305 [Pirellulales bacterium]|nr:hypothetical protein [Pirellulales bacterium]